MAMTTVVAIVSISPKNFTVIYNFRFVACVDCLVQMRVLTWLVSLLRLMHTMRINDRSNRLCGQDNAKDVKHQIAIHYFIDSKIFGAQSVGRMPSLAFTRLNGATTIS